MVTLFFQLKNVRILLLKNMHWFHYCIITTCVFERKFNPCTDMYQCMCNFVHCFFFIVEKSDQFLVGKVNLHYKSPLSTLPPIYLQKLSEYD